MKRPIIAIDIDDVLADSTDSFRVQINKKLGYNLNKAAYKVEGPYWGYYERVWEAHNVPVTKEQHAALDNEMIIDQMHVPLLPDVQFVIGELSKTYDIAIVTARNPAWEKATLAWLKHHFGDVFIDVHFAGNIHIEAAKTKGELCKEVGAKWLIDDNPGHCQTALDAGIQTILFGEYGWHVDIPTGAVHCKDWPEVLEFFNNAV